MFSSITLPDFVVITGENGAGKSHLLEAIANQSIHHSFGGSPEDMRYLTTEQLGAPMEFQGGEESRDAQVARLEAAVRQFDQIRMQPGYDTPEGARNAVHNLLQQSGLTPEGIDALEGRTSTPLADWTHDDFAAHTPADFGGLDPFAVRVGDVFSRYNQMLMSNSVNRMLAAEGQPYSALAPEEFVAEFGRPPWEMFNSALEAVGLRYRFQPPVLSALPMVGPPVLLDPITSVQLIVSMLSTGERALLSIAMSLYSVTNRRGLMKMPRLVLLDEPDAALHPSMIRSLITLLLENFVRDLGVGVILTTHSPTTVALAPEESLYVMYKSRDPRLQAAQSKDAALSHLLIGVPTVSVRAENRRVVVVESPHDERRYTAIETLLQGTLDSERSLVFMAAGGGVTTGGSVPVIDLVTRLRDNGNAYVWGLIDRDDLTAEPHSSVVYNPERYTAENFVLDPLSVGLLLLSEPHAAIAAAMHPVDYVNFHPVVSGQALSDLVTAAVATTNDDSTPVAVRYVGGFDLELPAFWLNTKGHELAPRVRAAFPSLKAHRDDNLLMDAVIKRIWGNRLGVIPASMADTFTRLLNS
ncbi:MAG: protein putative AbiEii toxin, Type system [Rhodoglobus sp.]|nr:protein putative AbiEii toxin, Type system [Rhodoglobus sp.]